MLNRYVGFIMIVLILIAQTGEAFAVSASSCFGANNMSMQMMMDNDENMQAHMDSDVILEQLNVDESMQHACCQHECECPQGLLSLAVLLDRNMQTTPNLASTLQFHVSSQLTDVFIPDQNRPPISLLFVTL